MGCFDSPPFSIPWQNLALSLQGTTLEGVSMRGFSTHVPVTPGNEKTCDGRIREAAQ